MVFIVAEIGVNWEGDYTLVKEMMQKSKEIGCNAVKFQAFEDKMIKDHPLYSRLIASAISKNNISIINELAANIGIEWFCTPMYPEIVKSLEPFVRKFKVRERDGKKLLENETTPLLEEIFKTGKEIIVSTQISPKFCKYYDHPLIKWLYCVPRYPCELDYVEFSNLVDFDGYSNHTPQIIAPLTASILGADIIEIHITSNKSKDFIDNNVSFDYRELAELVKNIRLVEKIKR